jgi:6-phosphogluconolactonase
MVRKFADIRQLSTAAVGHIIDIARKAVRNKGFCTIVMAGGSTPRLAYELLSTPANAEKMPWRQSHFFWGDERWVTSTHQDSNFAMAHEALLAKVRIPSQNIHRISTDDTNPEEGAARYEKHLRHFFHSKPPAEMKIIADNLSVPCFDLVLLGMGADGHTASLFPGSSLLAEKKKWVAAVPAGVGSPPVARITLTLPVLNGAKNIFFLVTGRVKMAILDTILTRPAEAQKLYPAARIKPVGNLVWLTSEQA